MKDTLKEINDRIKSNQLKVKLDWYAKLDAKLENIELGKMSLEDYRYEVANKINDLTEEIESI